MSYQSSTDIGGGLIIGVCHPVTVSTLPGRGRSLDDSNFRATSMLRILSTLRFGRKRVPQNQISAQKSPLKKLPLMKFSFLQSAVPCPAEPCRFHGTALPGRGQLAGLSTGHGLQHGGGRDGRTGPSARALPASPLLVPGKISVKKSNYKIFVSKRIKFYYAIPK